MRVKLYQGDCLDLLKRVPDGSVDMALCDLPYGTTQNKWDTPLPLDRLWAEYKRVCKGAMVFTAAQPFTSALVMSNVLDFKYDWVWHKPKGTGHLNARKQPMRDKEDILVFYKLQPTYNPQMTEGTPYKNKAGKDHTSISSRTASYGEYTNFRNDNLGHRYPKQVLAFEVVERGTLHPTQKARRSHGVLDPYLHQSRRHRAGQLYGLRHHGRGVRADRTQVHRHGAGPDVFRCGEGQD